MKALSYCNLFCHFLSYCYGYFCSLANGFFPLFSSMRYAHQGGQNPPIIVIHGNALEGVTEPYKRYLEKHFRDTFNLVGTPLRIELKSGKNPFAKEQK